MWGFRANTKSGANTKDCVRGSESTLPENIEILHVLKCFLGASEAPFCASIQYNHTYLQVAIFVSGFRSKSTTYGALARGHIRYKVCIKLKFASAA